MKLGLTKTKIFWIGFGLLLFLSFGLSLPIVQSSSQSDTEKWVAELKQLQDQQSQLVVLKIKAEQTLKVVSEQKEEVDGKIMGIINEQKNHKIEQSTDDEDFMLLLQELKLASKK